MAEETQKPTQEVPQQGSPQGGAEKAEKAEKTAEKKPKAARKKKAKKRSVSEGHVHISAGWNNTIVTITEKNGNVIAWSSSGASGFKGTRKSTPYAAQVASENALKKAKLLGLERVHVFLRGAGPGRDQALRLIGQSEVDILSISDVTRVKHGGCRMPRPRRV